MKDTITKEKLFKHPIEDIWKAISEGKKISEWFLNADFKPIVGYQYTFSSKEEDCSEIKGEVKKASPYELVYTWIVSGTSIETTVTWLLEPIQNGTKLTLTHTGIANYPHETAIKMFDSFTGGWINCLNLLNDYLAKYVEAN
ncbi:SRPBCC family protein [Tenacibaculum agarivorans]|uniref:SRPBCC family protein n=1 Tax=Tenacibaculum agarivorans TaxID=1908389 RepID=UPI00094BBAA9|nr:SRPBCC domain-containing protein [Tenacibaculum agarivorans]